MDAVAQTIRKLRDMYGLTQLQLSALTGISRAGIAKRETGHVRIKPPERKIFAKAFGMSINQFDELWRASKIEQIKGGDGIPVINRAPAGDIVDYEEYGTDSGQGFEYIDFGQLPQDQHLFAVVVTGDSMSPTLEDGEYAVFKPLDRERDNGKFKDGSICFVRFASEYKEQGCTIARVWVLEDGDLQLSKDNPAHKPRTVKRELVSQVAVAIERRVKFS